MATIQKSLMEALVGLYPKKGEIFNTPEVNQLKGKSWDKRFSKWYSRSNVSAHMGALVNKRLLERVPGDGLVQFSITEAGREFASCQSSEEKSLQTPARPTERAEPSLGETQFENIELSLNEIGGSIIAYIDDLRARLEASLTSDFSGLEAKTEIEKLRKTVSAKDSEIDRLIKVVEKLNVKITELNSELEWRGNELQLKLRRGGGKVRLGDIARITPLKKRG